MFPPYVAFRYSLTHLATNVYNMFKKGTFYESEEFLLIHSYSYPECTASSNARFSRLVDLNNLTQLNVPVAEVSDVANHLEMISAYWFLNLALTPGVRLPVQICVGWALIYLYIRGVIFHISSGKKSQKNRNKGISVLGLKVQISVGEIKDFILKTNWSIKKGVWYYNLDQRKTACRQ